MQNFINNLLKIFNYIFYFTHLRNISIILLLYAWNFNTICVIKIDDINI